MFKKIVISSFSLFFFLILSFNVNASTISKNLSGYILLQVQNYGEAWYVNPMNDQRYYLGRPYDAFQLMRTLSLGINNKDFDYFSGVAPKKLSGKILLKVEDYGKAYYVHPVSRQMTYLGRPADAFRVMREQSLGITNPNLSTIPVSGSSAIPPDGAMNIVIFSPLENQLVGLPLSLKGEARVFENTVNIRLKDSIGKIIYEDIVTAQSTDIGQFGDFEKLFSYQSPETKTGFLEVYTISAKDGSEIDKVIFNINFPEGPTTKVKVYFSNTQNDPNFLDCSKTFPVDRIIASTPSVGVTSISLLLSGPTYSETSKGYFSNINSDTALNSLSIADRTAYADFNSNLNKDVAGSCRVQAIRSQITDTLSQFPTVDDVVISVNGNTEEILQP